MKKSLLIWLLSILTISAQSDDLTRWVNPLIGTDSEFKLSNGNTYPAVALPWGMNFWTPQTARMGDGWQYAYDAMKINGFKQTHQPSPWINDYGAFAVMPVTGELKYKTEDRASWFSHKRETAKPHHYKTYLADYDTWIEFTPTDRAASFKVTYPDQNSWLIIDAYNKGSFVKIFPEEKMVIGYCKNNRGGVPDNFANYFVLRFDSDFDEYYTWEDSLLYSNTTEREGRHVGAIIKFRKGQRIVNFNAASSFISIDQAKLNLQREIGNKSFEEIMNLAKETWNKELNKIRVDGGSEAQLTNFYTALYRVLLFPRKLHELNDKNEVVHYSPYNGKILPGYMYTDNGFWDTFRAVHPFFTLMYPSVSAQIMEGLVNTFNESGWLPEWASPGHRDCMIGSNSASLIADAYLKGIRGYDINTLYKAVLKNSENEGPLSSVGRYGVKYYNSLGFIPYDVDINENAARTLEYSYNDFCIMNLAKSLGRPQAEVDTFAKRALYYRNVFDRSTNFMRGRNKDGSFQSPFRPDKWGDAFTEGCAWHWTWCVFHDPKGLIDLMGGNDKFTEKLDSVFVASPTFDDSYYGGQIHEITEMLIAGMGQYAHGNQPIQHAAYLYNYSGYPWKTQHRVREIMDLLYTPAPDGLCGDEDNGQTSAWYVFSAIGFYPVCPGTGQYVIGSPLFNKITLSFENGNRFTLNALNNNSENVFIQNAEMNGSEYNRNYLSHSEIIKGAELNLNMGNKPNIERGIKETDFPYSFSK